MLCAPRTPGGEAGGADASPENFNNLNFSNK